MTRSKTSAFLSILRIWRKNNAKRAQVPGRRMRPRMGIRIRPGMRIRPRMGMRMRMRMRQMIYLIWSREIQLAQTATGRMLLSMYSVAAWKVSVNSLSKRVNKFSGMKLTVHFYSCPPVPRTKGDPQLRAKLDQMFPNMGLTKGQKQFSKMLDHWAKAKVHAEAALMGWAFAQCQAHDPQFLTNDVAIAVSKKCCYLCWRLQQKLNQTRVLQLSLPGTHNGIFAWIPPSEIPEDILFQLRDELLTILRDVDHSYSRQRFDDSEDDAVITLDMVLHILKSYGFRTR
ncbi:hypothetical protein DFH05DRAFT_990342 [Lentinula detonsa]|uniref:Uncharacterized protein n=1 Tax=Lentinula detonsa TaxID=2804962 RepID=A0A9W8P4P2_9AGAR|nr:hypothetical protein DFH05DRAFT_990342 [Lentinula detonsa]